MDSYEFIRVVGKGSYGEVILVKHRSHGKQFVVKKLQIQHAKEKDRRQALQEARLLSELNHPNIVCYRESFQDTHQVLHIVMAYCAGGDLYTRLRQLRNRDEQLSEQQIMTWFVQIALALEYLHKKNILHRDLKTQNIFLHKNDIIKVGDLGIARVLEDSNDLAMTLVGTPYYMSPEILLNRPYAFKSDVWALGCVLYEMTALKEAFGASDFSALMLRVVRGKMPPMPSGYSNELSALIRCMLERNPDKRPMVNNLLRRPHVKAAIMNFMEHAARQRRPRSGRRSHQMPASDISRRESEERNRLDSKEEHQKTDEERERASKGCGPQQETQNSEDDKTIEGKEVEIDSDDESTLEPVTLLSENQLLPEGDDKHDYLPLETEERKTSGTSNLSGDHALSEHSGELARQSGLSSANSSSGYQSAGQQSSSSRESMTSASDTLDNTLAMIDDSNALRLSNDFSPEQSSRQDYEELKSCGGSPKKTVNRHVVAGQHGEEVVPEDVRIPKRQLPPTPPGAEQRRRKHHSKTGKNPSRTNLYCPLSEPLKVQSNQELPSGGKDKRSSFPTSIIIRDVQSSPSPSPPPSSGGQQFAEHTGLEQETGEGREHARKRRRDRIRLHAPAKTAAMEKQDQGETKGFPTPTRSLSNSPEQERKRADSQPPPSNTRHTVNELLGGLHKAQSETSIPVALPQIATHGQDQHTLQSEAMSPSLRRKDVNQDLSARRRRRNKLQDKSVSPSLRRMSGEVQEPRPLPPLPPSAKAARPNSDKNMEVTSAISTTEGRPLPQTVSSSDKVRVIGSQTRGAGEESSPTAREPYPSPQSDPGSSFAVPVQGWQDQRRTSAAYKSAKTRAVQFGHEQDGEEVIDGVHEISRHRHSSASKVSSKQDSHPALGRVSSLPLSFQTSASSWQTTASSQSQKNSVTDQVQYQPPGTTELTQLALVDSSPSLVNTSSSSSIDADSLSQHSGAEDDGRENDLRDLRAIMANTLELELGQPISINRPPAAFTEESQPTAVQESSGPESDPVSGVRTGDAEFCRLRPLVAQLRRECQTALGWHLFERGLQLLACDTGDMTEQLHQLLGPSMALHGYKLIQLHYCEEMISAHE